MFDPLAIMLLIAANQTLMRFGINLESSGPKPHFVDEIISDNKKDNVIIKEVEVIKEVSKEINMDAIKTPRAVTALEKKLKKKLGDDGTRS